jgi:hypothetical protein
MGLAAAGALVTIALAFIAQTPRLIGRLGLSGARLDLRARAFTGYGLAFLLLALGFFLAGVPIGQEPATTDEPLALSTAAPGEEVAVAGTVSASDDQAAAEATAGSAAEAAAPAGGSSSGMVVRPRETATAEAVIPAETGAAAGIPPVDASATGEGAAVPAPTIEDTPEPTAEATTTLVPTATPTPTPEPTQTPTPIVGPTARVGDNTSTLPVRKTPNGEPVALVYRGDPVLLLTGHAFHSGGLWREISTVDGVVGWVQDVFLDYGDGTG